MRPREPLEQLGRWVEKLIIGEVRTALWKLGRSRGFREMPHKVGSWRSPRRVGLLQTSVGGYFIPNIKYLKNTKDQWLIYDETDLKLVRFTDSSFQSDHDNSENMSGYFLILNDGAIY